MGITKNHIYTPEQIELARIFKALAHPARIAIVENLIARQGLNCNDLKSYIDLAQSTISGHIKELFEVGILNVRVVKNNAYYEVNQKVINTIPYYLKELLKLNKPEKRNMQALYGRPTAYTLPNHLRNYQT